MAMTAITETLKQTKYKENVTCNVENCSKMRIFAPDNEKKAVFDIGNRAADTRCDGTAVM
jgi:hypothetical protein